MYHIISVFKCNVIMGSHTSHFVLAKPVDKIQKLSIQTVMQPHFLIPALITGRTFITMLGFNYDLNKSPD